MKLRFAFLLGALCLLVGTGAATEPTANDAFQAKSLPPKQLFSGKVVLLREALTRHDVDSSKEMDGQVVLETPRGELIPIVADWRGKAFFQDERLRNRKVDLVGFRRPGVPYLQVLMVFTYDDQGVRCYTDYWCDICSIPMYEIKPCECCQGPSRLRLQPQELPSFVNTGGRGDNSHPPVNKADRPQ